MKIGLRAGHSPNCKGAIGLRDEYDCMIILYRYVRDVLVEYGHTVIDCNSNANTSTKELQEGVNKANSNKVDLFISLHMNSFNGSAYGVEAWTHSSVSRSNEVAQRLVNNFSELGFYNRGVKYKSSYYEMQNVLAPNIIFETCFCDNKKDIEEFWSPTPYEKMARMIANAIDTNIPKEETNRYAVKYYAFNGKENAIKFAKEVENKVGNYYHEIYKIN